MSLQPAALRELIAATPAVEWVVIDEIQKVPALLDVVHGCIEGPLGKDRGVRFAMTGSSARRLKRGAVNLLAGRAFVYLLFPLTARELGPAFDLLQCLRFGTLPATLAFAADADRAEFLRAYARTYLKEEVWSEQLIRRLDPFRRFLEVAAQCNGEILNLSNIARDVGVDHKTVGSYFEILEDTLLGFMLEPWHASIRKRQRQAPKFWWFDAGVARALAGTLTVDVVPRSGGFGRGFEHLVIAEIVRAGRRRSWRSSQPIGSRPATSATYSDFSLIFPPRRRCVFPATRSAGKLATCSPCRGRRALQNWASPDHSGGTQAARPQPWSG